jgi:hypothetical protein
MLTEAEVIEQAESPSVRRKPDWKKHLSPCDRLHVK